MPRLDAIGRLPDPADNCAIAIRDLPAGTTVEYGDRTFPLSHTVLEGHRFATVPITKGAELTSWGQRFGVATRDIAPGEYVMNDGVQTELARRNLDFALPPQPNFDNMITSYHFDENEFRAGIANASF